MTAREMQAHLVAPAPNLLLLAQDQHEQPGVVNTAGTERQEKRLEQHEQALTENGRSLPLIYQTLQRFTPATCKRIRRLRVHGHLPTALPQARLQLQHRDAKL